jgi:protein regulator of cytokinesis 1
VQVALPPTSDDAVCPPTFDLSPKYVAALDNEFTRVFAEYSRRIAAVREMSEEIVRLWAELGTPQAQTDSSIVKYHKDAPEQLGLHESDLQRLSSLKQGLSKQRSDREQRLKELKNAVEALWDRLGMEQADRKRFLNANRGCSLRVMNDFEDELARLNELKRQNLHLFVEDARCKLQDLWDALYFSEDEMLEFTPAFSGSFYALCHCKNKGIARR